ncbi:unnamed protein product [Polarella glacialis]|uniref:Uncharacterized protein n=1 Tax=Polarella glacialis TaxID=89957 RepID=A0A813DH18_POLGL|nr:unnamed protein product [Polarella glacialis]CAE8717231.1 unnamed protein product [Polarella glacialis]
MRNPLALSGLWRGRLNSTCQHSKLQDAIMWPMWNSTVWSYYNPLLRGAVSPPYNCTGGRFEKDAKNPALVHIGDIPGANISTSVTSSNALWVLDECKELAEAFTGAIQMLIIGAIGGVCCAAGIITVCVACCCCCCQQSQQGQASLGMAPPAQWQAQQPYGGAQMVGQPIVQGRIVQGTIVT